MREPDGQPGHPSTGKKAGADKARARSKCDESATCPIAATLSVLGDRWSILILRDLLLGLRRFDELVKPLGIATNILTDRLNKLSAEGLLTRTAYQFNPPRYEYEPTEAGEAYRQVIFAMMRLIDEKTGEETPFCETTGILTEWANEMAAWRVATAEAHANAEKPEKA